MSEKSLTDAVWSLQENNSDVSTGQSPALRHLDMTCDPASYPPKLPIFSSFEHCKLTFLAIGANVTEALIG